MDPLFEVHMLNDNGKEAARVIAENFELLLQRLQPVCNPQNKPTREWALVRTKLEEAAFYSKKCMALLRMNQQ